MGRAISSTPILTTASGVDQSGLLRHCKRYGLALACAAVAISIARLLEHTGQAGLYVPLIAAVAFSAWFVGIGPALFCQICGLVFAFYETSWPLHGGSLGWPDVYGLLLFILIGKLCLFLTANIHWNRTLRLGEQNLRLIAGATNDCLWEWYPKTGQVTRSGNLAGVYGCPKETIKEDVSWWRDRLHPDDRDAAWGSLQRSLAKGDDQWEAEYRLRQQDGSYLLIADRGRVVRDRKGSVVRVIGGMSDITAHRRAEERLAYDALHDTLTGLPNRALFRDHLEQQLKTGGHTAVLFIGLDRFKVVNDSLGHQAGDRVLRALSKRIQMSLHSGEFAARFGGDEFTLLVENVASVEAAEEAARRILASLSFPYQFEGHSLIISASIGIALAEAFVYPEEILRRADIAMYRAKARGRGRYEIFQPALDSATMNVLQRESEIRRGLEDGDFRLYYQPIIDLALGRISGFEALLRWQHPRRGVLLPGEFLPLAEESDLITELGRWSLETACTHLRAWRSMNAGSAALTVSVNLAGRQFAEPQLVSWLADLLAKHDLDGSALILELTENMILENNVFATTRLAELRQLGLRIAIDDFGKGHSSFGRLQDLQVSIVKIDGSFVRRIQEGKPEIVDAVIALAKQLRLEVTAECVETAWQFGHLYQAGCTSAQGLYFSAALSASATAELVATNRFWRAPTLAHAANS